MNLVHLLSLLSSNRYLTNTCIDSNVFIIFSIYIEYLNITLMIERKKVKLIKFKLCLPWTFVRFRPSKLTDVSGGPLNLIKTCRWKSWFGFGVTVTNTGPIVDFLLLKILVVCGQSTKWMWNLMKTNCFNLMYYIKVFLDFEGVSKHLESAEHDLVTIV